jgi:phosphatidylserine/phosphatidylglycerophosphate/cardiolipin synthase-like enzyme
MGNIDDAYSLIIPSGVTPLFGNYFYDELIKTIESATLSIYSIQYQWKWNTHERFSKIQMLGDAIRRARLRNVAVSVILNQESPRRHLSVINRVSGDKLGEYGCLVKHKKAGTLLHTKLWVIDNRYSFIGSHNISTRSLTCNEEVSVKIDSIEVARLMIEYFNRLWG